MLGLFERACWRVMTIISSAPVVPVPLRRSDRWKVTT